MICARLLTALCLLLPCAARGLELDAERYAAHSQVQWCWAVLTLDQIPFRGDERVADIGCGNGPITALMATRTRGLVLGVDPSVDALEIARTQFPAGETPNLHWFEGTASNLNAQCTFDLITSFCSLNWIEDKQGFFDDAARMLVDEGKLLIVLPAPPPAAAMGVMRKVFEDPAWEPYRFMMARPTVSYSMDDYIKFATNAGFKPVWSREVATEAVFSNPEELGEWLLAIRNDLRQLPKERWNAYLAGFTQMIQASYPQAGDGRVYSFPKKWELLFIKE